MSAFAFRLAYSGRCSARSLGQAISGAPAAPAHVALGTTYNITVTGTPPYYQKVAFLSIGSSSAYAGPYTTKGSVYPGTGCGVAASHTWNVVNQATGTYWWDGLCEFDACAGAPPGTPLAVFFFLPFGQNTGYGGYTTP